MAEVTIIPPEGTGESKGRGGARPGAGRPPGSVNVLSADIKQMVMEALDGLGGINYLMLIGATKPEIFCSLVGRVIPMQKNTPGGDDEAHVIREVRRTVVLK